MSRVAAIVAAVAARVEAMRTSPRYARVLPYEEALLALAAFGLALGTRLWVAYVHGIRAPMGPDPALWGLAARAWRQEGQLSLPPLLPVLASLLSSLGASIPVAAQGVARVAGAGVAAAVFWAARQGGASRPWAFAAATAAALLPDLVIDSLFLQPESLTALLFALALGAAWRLGAAFTWGRLALFGLCVGAIGLAREHGAALLWPACAYAAWVAPPGRRLAAVALMVTVVHLSASPLGVPLVRFPGSLPGVEKAGVVLRDLQLLLDGRYPSYLRLNNDAYPTGRELLLNAQRCAYPPSLPGAVVSNFLRTLVLAGDLHLVIWGGALAAGAVFRQRGGAQRGLAWAIPALAACLLPSFVIWSQRRHATVVEPIGLAGLAVAATAWRELAARHARAVRWGVVGLVLSGLAQAAVGFTTPDWLVERARVAWADARLGVWLKAEGYQALATTSELVSGDAGRVALYADLPFVVGNHRLEDPVAFGGAKVALITRAVERRPVGDWTPIGDGGLLRAWGSRNPSRGKASTPLLLSMGTTRPSGPEQAPDAPPLPVGAPQLPLGSGPPDAEPEGTQALPLLIEEFEFDPRTAPECK